MIDEGEVPGEIVQSDDFNEKVYTALVRINHVLVALSTLTQSDTTHTSNQLRLLKLTILVICRSGHLFGSPTQ